MMHPEINVRAVGCSKRCARRLDDEDGGRYAKDDEDDDDGGGGASDVALFC
jgi:hypothetical protein